MTTSTSGNSFRRRTSGDEGLYALIMESLGKVMPDGTTATIPEVIARLRKQHNEGPSVPAWRPDMNLMLIEALLEQQALEGAN